MQKRLGSQNRYISGNDPIIVIVKKCPVCGSNSTEDYLNTNLTTFFFPVPEKLIKKVEKEPFKLRICKKCSHIFQTDIKKDLLELIYNKFYKHYNLDTSIEFQKVYRERTIEFIKEILSQEKDQKVLDLGCGEGTYFPFFETFDYECYGIEPSEKAVIAKEKNPNAFISHQYFENSKVNIFKTKFDIILMNWVLEHILELDSFFKKLEKYIKTKTKIIIQVPDIRYYINNNLPLFYVHEHINYFTIETLRLLLERKGFIIIGQMYGDSPSILICGEYTGIKSTKEVYYPGLIKMKKIFLKKNVDLKKKIIKNILVNEKIILYGMGLLAFWIGDFCLDNIDLKKIELIDDNEFYRGKVVPLFNKKLKLFPPGYNLDKTFILICTSPVYHDKVKKLIKEKYVGNYKIAFVKNNDLMIE